jgi:hypothetical protein
MSKIKFICMEQVNFHLQTTDYSEISCIGYSGWQLVAILCEIPHDKIEQMNCPASPKIDPTDAAVAIGNCPFAGIFFHLFLHQCGFGSNRHFVNRFIRILFKQPFVFFLLRLKMEIAAEKSLCSVFTFQLYGLDIHLLKQITDSLVDLRLLAIPPAVLQIHLHPMVIRPNKLIIQIKVFPKTNGLNPSWLKCFPAGLAKIDCKIAWSQFTQVGPAAACNRHPLF